MTKKTITELNRFLMSVNMQAGISQDFAHLADLRKNYLQAATAIEIGLKMHPDQLIYTYDEFRFYHLIDLCANHSEIKELCHPALIKLIEYDKTKNTDMAETLYCYMKSGRSQADAAKYLNLHRGSLKYRLGKIEEIMGISLDDYLTFLHLQLSYEILKFPDSIKSEI